MRKNGVLMFTKNSFYRRFIVFILLSVSVLFEIYGQSQAYEGYTLYSSFMGSGVNLIDMDGNTVHSWNVARGGYSVYLLESGNIIYPAESSSSGISGAASSGLLQEIDWDGNVVWEFDYKSSNYCAHHDIEPMPDGNVLMIAWEVKSGQEASDAGFSSSNEVWPDHIIEVQQQGTSGQVVWEWHAWDHLVQDNDASKPNYGVVADHPELFSVDLGGGGNPFGKARSTDQMGMGDWMHVNGVSYNQDLDQIVFSSHYFDEVCVIDHSTTTAEAAGHTGGNSGKGGDLLYRWGCPQNYGASGTQYFDVVHCGTWVATDCPECGGSNIMAFNNNSSERASEIIEINPPVDESGNYSLTPGAAYSPSEPFWTYSGGTDFYSSNLGRCQRLPNGNTFIVESNDNGYMFEVTESGEKVWEYNPGTQVARANRYGTDYAGLSRLNTTTKIPQHSFSEKKLSIYNCSGSRIGEMNMYFNNPEKRAEVAIFSINGKQLVSRTIRKDYFRWDSKQLPSGLYLLKINTENEIFTKYIHLIK